MAAHHLARQLGRGDVDVVRRGFRRRPPQRVLKLELPLLLLLLAEVEIDLRRGLVVGARPKLARGVGGGVALRRLALALGLAGFLLLRGLASPRCALLALFVVPVPHMLADMLWGDDLAPELFRAASRLLGLFGWGVAAGQHEVLAGAARLEVDSTQAGLPAVVCALGLAVDAALRRGVSLGWLGGAAVAAVAIAFASHFVAVVLSSAALVAGSATLSAFAVDTLGWAIPAGAVAWWVERAERRAGPAEPAPHATGARG